MASIEKFIYLRRLSGWLAHVKFFGESQIQWIDDELHFGWWKDKIPATFKVFVSLLIIAGVVFRLFFVCPAASQPPNQSPIPASQISLDQPDPPATDK